MKITPGQFRRISETYKKNRTNKPEGKGTPKSGDKVNLSKEAQELKQIYKTLKKTPQVRTEKVKQLKQAVQQGTYQVNGDKVAEKMLEGAILNRIIK